MIINERNTNRNNETTSTSEEYGQGQYNRNSEQIRNEGTSINLPRVAETTKSKRNEYNTNDTSIRQDKELDNSSFFEKSVKFFQKVINSEKRMI